MITLNYILGFIAMVFAIDDLVGKKRVAIIEKRWLSLSRKILQSMYRTFKIGLLSWRDLAIATLASLVVPVLVFLLFIIVGCLDQSLSFSNPIFLYSGIYTYIVAVVCFPLIIYFTRQYVTYEFNSELPIELNFIGYMISPIVSSTITRNYTKKEAYLLKRGMYRQIDLFPGENLPFLFHYQPMNVDKYRSTTHLLLYINVLGVFAVTACAVLMPALLVTAFVIRLFFLFLMIVFWLVFFSPAKLLNAIADKVGVKSFFVLGKYILLVLLTILSWIIESLR